MSTQEETPVNTVSEPQGDAQSFSAGSGAGDQNEYLVRLAQTVHALSTTVQSLQERLDQMAQARAEASATASTADFSFGFDEEATAKRQLEELRRKVELKERAERVSTYIWDAIRSVGLTGNEPELYRPTPQAWERNPEEEGLKMLNSAVKALGARFYALYQQMQRQQQASAQPQPSPSGQAQGAPRFETERPAGASVGAPDWAEKLAQLPHDEFMRRAEWAVKRALRGEEVRPEELVAGW